MGERLLNSIIELEKALQAEVAREEARAAAWREREFAALELTLATARRQLQELEVDRLASARRDAETCAEGLRQDTAAWCERLAALPDSLLREVLLRHLPDLLPETSDDHPHVQG
jgi:hypothetical protein